eukprot:TRINITY_DN66893_c1_g2_i1.p1 TRINITY_DN66893_c1_g2~~TRINITY_DN66893_c1_g2_i1.p1  ORF type:complete len:230 (+),score=12.32 TRINITY_DN66893_c1_g2_i1:23-691(+)
MARELYSVLGVSRDASQQDIVKAFRQLSLKFHPDKNKQEDKEQSEESFKEVVRAFEILNDEDKRAEYDAILEKETKRRASQEETLRRRHAHFAQSQTNFQTPHSKPPPQPPPKQQAAIYICPNRQRGCTWSGPRNSLRIHLTNCGHCEDWVVSMRAVLKDEITRGRTQTAQLVKRHKQELDDLKRWSGRWCFLGLITGFMLGVSIMILVFALYGAIDLRRLS